MFLAKLIRRLRQIQMVGVGGILINENKEILLTKRIEKKFPPWNGKWGIPGGHVEFGENPEETLHREMKEELGAEVKILSNNPLLVSKSMNFGVIFYHGILLAYLCKIVKGIPKKTSAEHTDLKWFKKQEINFKNCIPSTKEFIEKLDLNGVH